MGLQRGTGERSGVETSSALPFSLFIYRHPAPEPGRSSWQQTVSKKDEAWLHRGQGFMFALPHGSGGHQP